MHDYSQSISSAACSRIPRIRLGHSLKDRIILRLQDFLFATERPQGRRRIEPGYRPQLSHLEGYHAPCYPPAWKQTPPVPIERGAATWDHSMFLREHTL